jgi:DNA-binding CsgD family transcriptional regulator
MRQTLSYYHSLEYVDVGLLRTQPMLGVTLVMRGDLDAALALAPLCEQLCDRLGERWQRSYVHYFVGVALRGNNDAARAVEHLTTAIEIKHQFHDVFGLVMCFEQLAGVHADLGDGERAARLLGAAEQLLHSNGLRSSVSPFHSAEYQRAEQHARNLLGTRQYEAALRQGLTTDLDTFVANDITSARSPAPRTEPVSHRPGGRDVLTRRERQVADLVGRGLTNREIAAHLVVSVRTAESHVQNIMTKLGFTSRIQLAAWSTARSPQRYE